MAKSWNMRLFKHLRRACDAASKCLAEERGPCPDAAERGVMERFSHKLAIAPTASISIICGGTSAGIEPIPANIYTHKTLSGSFAVKNPYLERLLDEKDRGHARGVELDPGARRLRPAPRLPDATTRRACSRPPSKSISAGSSISPPIARRDLPVAIGQRLPAGDVDKWDLHMLHWQAWERGVKSLYYLRSKSVQRAAFAGGVAAAEAAIGVGSAPARTDYEECLACQ